MTTLRTLSPALARRLAVTRQRLAGPPPAPNAAGMMDVLHDIRCLQLDPISTVARSHLLVLWSRLGAFDPATLDRLLWEERRLFEYWAHCASMVLTEDYPLYQPLMRAYAGDGSSRAARRRAWVEQNRALHDHILHRLRTEGPLPSRLFEDHAEAPWHSTGWTSGRNTSQMLNYLWLSGVITVAGRAGAQKLWDLSERVLPEWTPREEVPEDHVVRRAAEIAIRALGVARPGDIRRHFLRDRYENLPAVLADLEREGRIERVRIAEDGHAWPGVWYLHAEDAPLLERLEAGDWSPRTTLLSPFDNLICDRARTTALFGFDFRIEIYTPKAQRRFGYYVLPILHGDRLIGRIDPVFERRHKRLVLNAVHIEPDAPADPDTGRAVVASVESLAAFLGAREIARTGPDVDSWALPW
jgi:uncharacterized protein YcaQ